MHYQYKGQRLQTSQASNGTWICFINETDPLLPAQQTEAAALGTVKAEIEIRQLDAEGYDPSVETA